MRKFLARSTPPGISAAGEVKFFLIWQGLAVLFSLGTLARYLSARNTLFEWAAGHRYLVDGAVIADFRTLIGPYFLGFGMVLCAMLGGIIGHYAYYRRGSMSIYLMRRLPRPFERHRRALTLPLLGAALTAVLALLVYLLYFVIYLLATPKVCLPDEVWRQLWRIF